MKLLSLLVSATVGAAGAASAAQGPVYECDVAQSALIMGGHPEAAGPEIGSADDPDRVFAIQINSPEAVADCDKACKRNQSVREIPTQRSRKSSYDLCESGGNYVLMHPYAAHAVPDEFTVDFRSTEDLGFLRLIGPFDKGETYRFWHSGFEYPGCEDTHLVIRTGACKRRK